MSTRSDKETLSPSEIIFKAGTNREAVIDPKLKELPLNQSWELFEALCLELLNDEYALDNIRGMNIYGRAGQKQFGIDIVGLDLSSLKKVVAQCKRYKKVNPNDISSWVDKFLDECDPDEYQEFILCTSASIQSDTKLVDAWHIAEKLLIEKGIVPTLWDYPVLQEKLRRARVITEKYYGTAIAEKFCSEILFQDKYPYSFSTEKCVCISDCTTIENRTIRLDVLLPRKSKVSQSACFMFTRSDLNGVTISCDGKTLVRFMQERAHTKSIKETSLIQELKSSENRYILVLPDARLTLQENEVTDLDWIISKAWDKYVECTTALESDWKTARFDRLNDNSFIFKLCKIERWFWKEIIEYANEFDVSNGNSDMHVFDAAPGCLKVYVNRSTANLDVGYHLILYPHTDDSVYTTDFYLGWEPLSDIVGEPVEISSRKAWCAEYTHNWLFDVLFPAVYRRVKDKHRKRNRSFLSLVRRPFTKKIDFRELSDFCRSYAKTQNRNIGLRVNNLYEASKLVYTLQSHFYAYFSNVEVEKQLVINTLKACLVCTESTPDYENPYVSNNLSLGEGPIHRAINILLTDTEENVYATPKSLDICLRSLYSIIEDKEQLQEYELNLLSELLKLVWERYIEDRICTSYF